MLCCVIGLVPGVLDYRALIFRAIQSVLALLDSVFHCNVRDCTCKDSGTSRKTQIFATIIESNQGREHKFFKTNSLPSVVFRQVAAPKPSMHFFFLLYILYVLPIYFPVILSPKQHLVRSTNYGTAGNAVLTSPVYFLSVRPNCVLRYYINISD
jgi:hypothetical protein